ncbi:serine/threonine-protein kinase [Dactylosporangium sp. NPDC000521]|uniref:serine/threonine-protein kinase n=1 Tax=Dactylosporangium sp. NPDC000521 TaxID=3363975 RepID=UPI0036AA523E
MTDPLGTGTVVTIGAQRWSLGDKLGQGGGGAVFAALSDDGVSGAVKFVVKTGEVPRDNVIERPSGRLRNILPIWACGEYGPWWVFVMPRGEISLENYLLRRATRLERSEALAVLTDVATALHDLEIHDGVVHRDLKPGNVMQYQQQWHLVDFGIARVVEAATATLTKRAALSAPYAAPERWREDRSGCPADVYSWGVMAYEVFSGRIPFQGPERSDFRDQHLHEAPPALDTVEAPLATLVAECLGKSPRSRPTAAEILSRLQSLNRVLPKGLQDLRNANEQILHGRLRSEILAERQRSTRESSDDLYQDALASFRRLSQRFRSELNNAAGVVEDRTYRSGWRLKFGNASLSLSVPRHSVDYGKKTAGLSFSVIAYAQVALEWSDPGSPHTGRSHALWYCDAGGDGRFDWHELAFRWSGHRTSAEMPFARDVDAEVAAVVMGKDGKFAVAVPPHRINHGSTDEFIERWAEWFATAAMCGGVTS